MSGRWSLIVHGGAKDIPPEEAEANRQGMRRASEAGIAVLREGGTAVAAVEAAIRAMEDDPTFNAGYGSEPDADGKVRMDALLMDGKNLDIGAVCAIQGVRHPITVARLMLRETPVLISGGGARTFGAGRGAELCDPDAMIAPEVVAKQKKAKEKDTVGAVALDIHGDIACGTSTGGLEETVPGRVGDTALPGCGSYADNGVGGVSFSGDGEMIARTLLAARVMRDLERDLDPEAAARAAVAYMEQRVGGEAGGIVIDRRGRLGWSHNSTGFAIAYATSEKAEPRVFLSKDEEEKGG
ncbi:MAG TPA: isoaspartyl peptidase/L-asparaginase family protein [Azospirillaceae bacterium]|nr:isoaspartyl peptidase/L-asparaginase family protein [Azospirillaceae bacterium]